MRHDANEYSRNSSPPFALLQRALQARFAWILHRAFSPEVSRAPPCREVTAVPKLEIIVLVLHPRYLMPFSLVFSRGEHGMGLSPSAAARLSSMQRLLNTLLVYLSIWFPSIEYLTMNT